MRCSNACGVVRPRSVLLPGTEMLPPPQVHAVSGRSVRKVQDCMVGQEASHCPLCHASTLLEVIWARGAPESYLRA
ncbi:unnamed protein product, partial [Bubo scandiacus]